MKLADLEPVLLKYNSATTRSYATSAYPSEADGIVFLCPKCFAKNGGPVGTHSVICWFTGRVPDDTSPGPGRWTPAGSSVHDLSFVGKGSISIQLMGGCEWHGYIRNGEAVDA